MNKWNDLEEAVRTTLYINEQEIATHENSSNDMVYTFEVDNINIEGAISIKLKNTSESTKTLVIDNISWIPYFPVTAVDNPLEMDTKIYPNPSSGIASIWECG